MAQPNEERSNVRNAGVEDLDQVSLLIRDAYQEYQANFSPEVWERYSREIMDVRSRLDTSELIVAENSGRLVGAVTFYPNTSPSDQGGWPAGWTGIRLLAVHPDARGMGIGRVLMDECLRRSRLLSATALGLHTTELMGIAQGMYERMGFVRVPEYDFQAGPEVVVLGYRLDL
jgi:predicted N-acetyltransferase YhbS